MAVAGEILVLPFFGQGHLFPCIELCKHLSSRNFQITLIISSALSSSIPATLSLRHPLVRISEIPGSGAPPPPPPEASGMRDSGPPSGDPFGRQHDEMGQGIESLLSGRPDGSPRPVCVVIDVMMSWSKEIFAKFGIPTVAFFTSGACSAAMEYSTWKARVDELKPGETRSLPGLPDDVAVSYSDLQRPPHGGPGAPGSGPPGGPPPMGRGFGAGGPPPFGRGFGAGGPPPFGRGSGPPGSMKPFPGPPKVGGEPMWLQEVEGTIALMMNTSHDLEGPFLDYVGQQMGKPVWGVGPLLPEEYWNSAGSVLHDRDMRPKKQSSHSEEEVIQWLDAKPQGSVLYISFGSEVGPSEKEYAELASALEESNKSFIWVVRPGSGRPGPPPALLGGSDQSEKREEEGYYPHGLESKAGERGMIIHGWAPQLLILSHPSTGGFLTHCGWNSTVEAIGRGVPMLAWPIRGDQFFNAKLVVCHLKIGHKIKEGGMSEMVVKDDIVKGIDKLMGDQEAKARAMSIGEKFECGFPATSEAAFDAFKDFLDAKPE